MFLQLQKATPATHSHSHSPWPFSFLSTNNVLLISIEINFQVRFDWLYKTVYIAYMLCASRKLERVGTHLLPNAPPYLKCY